MEKFKIGDLVYPVDNSCAKNLTTGKNEMLAGTAWSNPIQVRIVSDPYKEDGHEFIQVKYNGNVHRVLNNLTTKFDNSIRDEFYHNSFK